MKYFYLILISMFFSCKKKVEKPVTLRNQIEELMLLKNYKILSKKKINDSIEFYNAENKYFTINGNFNIKRNKKTSWWIVKQKNKYKSLIIQYCIFGKDSFKNQIIFYDKKVIDTASSKFYSVKKDDNFLKIYFHSPASNKDNFESAFFTWRLIHDRKIVKEQSVRLKNSNGNYYTTIDLEETNADEVGGFFTEVTKRKPEKNKLSAGINTIYIFNEAIK